MNIQKDALILIQNLSKSILPYVNSYLNNKDITDTLSVNEFKYYSDFKTDVNNLALENISPNNYYYYFIKFTKFFYFFNIGKRLKDYFDKVEMDMVEVKIAA